VGVYFFRSRFRGGILFPDEIRVVTRNAAGRKCLQINCRRLEMCLNHL